MEMKQLIPKVDYTDDISSFPLLVLQVTHFKCGGASLGVGMQHHVADGSSGLHFINSWSDLSRGLPISILLSSTAISSAPAPTPSLPSPTSNTNPLLPSPLPLPLPLQTIPLSCRQPLHHHPLPPLPPQSQSKSPTSSYALLAAHIWRCVSIARDLPRNQTSKMYIATDGRQRLRPPLPAGYFGNVIFTTTPLAASESYRRRASINGSAHSIRLKPLDDEYLRSALDYLELQPISPRWCAALTPSVP
ncbi:hypothetical protein KFK09_011375 [Dendrobium nobile]|uniref:Shikimate O-hydroxycinnamoyltransferase n=1 Tax=Dendrobium nobile TaxID=94219 RepID=A0A8T3BCP8_DENNO|nr:hypothetical protein KFK09_011375 [Dendrobium nobile]